MRTVHYTCDGCGQKAEGDERFMPRDWYGVTVVHFPKETTDEPWRSRESHRAELCPDCGLKAGRAIAGVTEMRP